MPALQVLEVTPRPEAMRCQLSLQLPAGVRLRRLTAHGSFNRLLSTKAAPEVFIHTRALSRWVACCAAHQTNLECNNGCQGACMSR